jgi:ATP-dependent DNA helicase RecG
VLTDSQLEELLRSESDRAERKRSPSDRDRLREAVCAFANDMPGYGLSGVIFVGVNDDGSCAGLAIDDPLLLSLASIRDDGTILPFPSVLVQKRTLSGCDIAVVEVAPSHTLPVRYRGRVWIRVGPRKAIATSDEERHLIERQRGFDLPYDARESSLASIDDIDVGYIRDEYLPRAVSADTLAQNERTLEHQLRSIHLLGPGGLPTNVGLIIAGIDPQAWLPGAYVQFLRIDGTELTDNVRDEKVVSGRGADVLRRLDDIFQANNQVGVSFTEGTTERRTADYPLPAFQQLARNAVMHRNYEGTNAPIRIFWFNDRIEIHSPGGPFGRVNRTNFGQPHANDYRNPLLAEALRNLGFVQRFGVGIALAQRELASNGNPPAEFDVQLTAVLAVLRRRT